MEKREKKGRLTVRSTENNTKAIKEIAKQNNLTLEELLLNPILKNGISTKPILKLDELANCCTTMMNSFQNEKDKEIFTEGMVNLWEILLKN